MPSAYIETTIPSYYVANPSTNLIQAARQASTRLWWDSGCSGFDLYTSEEAIDEAGYGNADMAADRLSILLPLMKLNLTDAVEEVAEELIEKEIIPTKAASDAIHIAVASVHKMDYLVTWNLKYIANPFIRDRMRNMISNLGFQLPVICNPEELIDYDEDTKSQPN